MQTRFADYRDGLVNLSCSVQKYFGIQPVHPTHPVLDEALAKKPYRNVIFLLFDGMGYNILNRTLEPDSFFRSHLVCPISSVLPSTTTAATTAVVSALTPYEHGWMGWDVYFKELDRNVTLYPNTLQYTDIPAAPYHVAERYAPYRSLMKQIDELPDANATDIQPFGYGIVYTDPDEMFDNILEFYKRPGRNFAYAYSPEPDSIMHHLGTDAPEVRAYLEHVDRKVKELSEQLTDTLLVIIADHGHLNVEPVFLADYPELHAMLQRDPSMEPRCCSFKVRPGCEERFKRLFQKHLGKWFHLLTAAEAAEKGLFGSGKPAPNLEAALGDFIAIAHSNRFILKDRSLYVHRSTHAGITEDEMLVPLILVSCE